MEGIPGPPMDVRLAAQDVEDILAHYGFEAMLTSEVGLLHYLVKTVSKVNLNFYFFNREVYLFFNRE